MVDFAKKSQEAKDAAAAVVAAVAKEAAETVMKNGQTTTTVATYQTGDEEAKTAPMMGKEERVSRDLPATAYSKVTIGLGMTKSLGDFEFARVDVSIEDFCEATPEARAARMDEIREEARTALRKIVMGIKGAKG